MAVLTETFHRHSGVYVLVVLAQAHVVHVVGGRVADDVCQSSARTENSRGEERLCTFTKVSEIKARNEANINNFF